MSKKIVDKLRSLEPGQSTIISGKKDTIVQTCWREQKDGKKFKKRIINEGIVTFEIIREI